MLRHVLGLLAGLAVTPLLWAGTAWAASEIGSAIESLDFNDPMLLSAIAAMMAVGLLCGLLAGSRMSPLAALVSGGLLLGVSLWPLVDYASLAALLPGTISPGSLFHPMGPALPLGLALGTLLFISALAPSRWRSRRRPFDDEPTDAYGQHTNPPVTVTAGPNAAGYPDPVHPRPEGTDDIDDSSKTTTPFRREAGGVRPDSWTGNTTDSVASPDSNAR
ncbi:hypothetical protein [Salinactinospora qingdaonensis]|uniref:Tryptophan-associated transmembrane protein (Trp_oprn_chp) n=1 Tax=Salinactinospora qingdaonensis TaxID=702744 RepID=A0ABP7FZ38_9ACTN